MSKISTDDCKFFLVRTDEFFDTDEKDWKRTKKYKNENAEWVREFEHKNGDSAWLLEKNGELSIISHTRKSQQNILSSTAGGPTIIGSNDFIVLSNMWPKSTTVAPKKYEEKKFVEPMSNLSTQNTAIQNSPISGLVSINKTIFPSSLIGEAKRFAHDYFKDPFNNDEKDISDLINVPELTDIIKACPAFLKWSMPEQTYNNYEFDRHNIKLSTNMKGACVQIFGEHEYSADLVRVFMPSYFDSIDESCFEITEDVSAESLITDMSKLGLNYSKTNGNEDCILKNVIRNVQFVPLEEQAVNKRRQTP